MANRCVDDNQELIDFTEEDDSLIAFHSLEDARVSDNEARRRRSLLRKSLGWDSAFFTSEGLLSPEELVMINKGFKKSNPTTQKDAKRSTKIAFKKMSICSQIKDKVTSLPKLFSLRQTNNNAAVGRSDNDDKIINKTRKAQESKMSSTCFTSPAVQKTVHHTYKSPFSAKGSTKTVDCNSFKETNNCSQNKDMVTRLPKSNAAVERSNNGVKVENKTKKDQVSKRSPSGGLPKLTCFTSPTIQKTVHQSKSIKGKVNPKNMKLVDSPTSVFHFPLSPSSTSPASFVDGESLSSSTVSHQSCEERKFISQNATTGSSGPKRKIRSLGPRTPSPKIGLFDEVVDLSSQDQSNLSPRVSTGHFLIAGKNLSRKPDGRKVGSTCSKSKSDGQIPKKILKNRMMSLDEKSLKDDCGSFQAEKQNVHSFNDEVNDLSGQLEVIDLERVAVEVKGQRMHSSFKDDNLQLIDCSKEDDCSIPFPYRNSLDDLRLSATFDNVHEEVQSEPIRQSNLLRKSLAWDSAFFTSAGLLNPEELYMINKGFTKSNPTTPKDAKRSKVATKIGGNQSNALPCKKMNNAAAVKGPANVKLQNETITAQDSNRSRPGGLPKLTSCTPTVQKAVHHSHGPPSKHLSKSVKKKVSPKNMKSVNSPSSVLHFLLSSSSTSPASSIDGGSLSSTPVTRQNAITVLDFQSQEYEERKFIGQKERKASGLRMPSPRIGFFDMEPGSMKDQFRYSKSQFQLSNLSCVSAGNRLKAGIVSLTRNNCVDLSGPTKDTLKRIGLGPYQEYSLHSRTPLAGKMLSFNAEFYD